MEDLLENSQGGEKLEDLGIGERNCTSERVWPVFLWLAIGTSAEQ
jgi:hypothetical protein